VIKYQPTNQEDDDSTVNEVGVFTFAIVKTKSKSNCNGCENETYVHYHNAIKISSRYRKGCRQLLRVIEKMWVGCQHLLKTKVLPLNLYLSDDSVPKCYFSSVHNA
jgi:hypothetical protein